MKLLIDADAFPNRIKHIVDRAINKNKITTLVVSNKQVFIGSAEYYQYYLVDQGADEADDKIVELCEEEDLVLTADIPLAERIIEKKALALNFHGVLWNNDNIKQALSMRSFYQDRREEGLSLNNNKPFSDKDATLFANEFSKLIAAGHST